MRIGEPRLVEDNGRPRVTSRITHEAIDRPDDLLFFEVPPQHGAFLRESSEAFLLACFPAALFHGEERILVEGPLCPELASNLKAAMLLQKSWWGDAHPVPRIECSRFRILERASGHTAAFISGGVDSLSNFCQNILRYEPGDPRRIRYGLFVYGLDVGGPNSPERHDVFDNTTDRLRRFLGQHGCELIPVYTNARNVETHWQFYEERHFGALLAGIAHAMSQGFDRCQTALDLRADYTDEWGSHPWLNKYFSSSGLALHSMMDSFTRVEKYEFFRQVPEVLDVLRVCYTMNAVEAGQLNCGTCAKCTRTKVDLLAQGLLERATTFADKAITPESLSKLTIRHRHDLEFLGEPIPLLRERGHDDLANHLQTQVDRYRRPPTWRDRIVRKVRQIDERHLNNVLVSTAWRWRGGRR